MIFEDGRSAPFRRVPVLPSILDDAALAGLLPGQVLIGDENYHGRDFEAALAHAGLCLLRPARQGETTRPGIQFFKPLRQIIEPVNDTSKGQLDLEWHGGHTPAGVITYVTAGEFAGTPTAPMKNLQLR